MTINDDPDVRRETIAYDAAGARLTPDLPPRPVNTPPSAQETAQRAVDPLRGRAEAIISDWEEQASERDRRDPMRARIMQEAAVIRAALAAAPQPAPQPEGCGLPCGFDCNGACFDWAAAPQPAPVDPLREAANDLLGTVYNFINCWKDPYDDTDEEGNSLYETETQINVKSLGTSADSLRAALAAAPQPAPTIVGVDMASGPDFTAEYVVMRPSPTDREKLVAVIREANDDWIAGQSKPTSRPEAIADALIAAGLRLPGFFFAVCV